MYASCVIALMQVRMVLLCFGGLSLYLTKSKQGQDDLEII